jgi:NADH-quinone oxidoreductase subunit F
MVTTAPARPVAEIVDRLVAEIGRGPEVVIPLLQALQREYRYLPEAALRRIAEVTEITPAALAGVSSFYSQFRHHPIGRHLINICHGTACHVKGAERVTEALYRHLGLEPDQETDSDGIFTVQRVACLGCCTLAPCMQVDGVTYGHLTPESIPQALADFLELRRRTTGGGDRARLPVGEGLAEIRIGVGSCCLAGGSGDVSAALERAVRDLAVPAVVKPVGCVGICHQTPLVEVVLPGREPAVYARVQAADAEAIVRRHFRPRSLFRRARAALSSGLDKLLTDEAWEPVTRYALDVRDAPVCDFLGPQRHLVTQDSGCLDPLDLDEYEAAGGFTALRRCLGSAVGRGLVPRPSRCHREGVCR